MRKVELIPFKESWAKKFSEESKRLKEIYDGELLNIHHIGSTSIPGMLAKPIIDILIEVQNIENIDLFNNNMKKLGYVPRGENGIVGRRYFIKENDNIRTHHVHIYQTGASEISKHLIFRDYLIENQHEAERYKEHKGNIYQTCSDNVKLYQEKKASLIFELTENGLNWANRNKKISVAGFILRERDNSKCELLTLSFCSIPNAYLRVPGGGVDGSESLEKALYREIKEETGLADLNLIRKMGTIIYYKPFIKRIVERHDFLLSSLSDTLDFWVHRVTGKDKDSGMFFEYKWIQSHDFLKIDGELRSFLSSKYIPELFNG